MYPLDAGSTFFCIEIRKKAYSEKKWGGDGTASIHWKKSTVIICSCLLAGAIGIVSGIWLSRTEESALGVYMEFFLENFLYEDVMREELLRYVLLHRSVLFFLGATNGTNLMKNSTKVSLLAITLYFVGYGWGVLVLRYHAKAVVILIGMLTPQWYFYGCSLFFSERMRKTFREEKLAGMWRNTALFAAFFSIGVLSEVTINPIWMKFLVELL
ncbi:hypothetical protein SAMN02910358_00275 [Lachnospiraceae bacterium XBB1006]|nr:hypothetical protein SAMN02910358_00275 [Lachnospiraceae bacterium XBB1006]